MDVREMLLIADDKTVLNFAIDCLARIKSHCADSLTSNAYVFRQAQLASQALDVLKQREEQKEADVDGHNI